jgi:PAS domain S-box-containing protein
MLSRLIYCTPFVISAFSVLAAAVRARRSNAQGAGYLIALCLSAAVYSLFEGLRCLATDLQTDMIMTYIQYLGIAALIPSAILFSLSVFGLKSGINRATVSLLLIFALATVAVAWTDPLHHLVYADVRYVYDGAFPMRVYTPGIFWWVFVVYNYLLMVVFTLLQIHVLQTSSGLLRTQASLFLVGAICVWIVHAVFISGFSPIPYMDISPLAFILLSIFMVIAFFRYSFLDVLPIARSEIFQRMGDPIIVLDRANHILDLNPAAETLLGVHPRSLFGQDIAHLLKDHPVTLEAFRENVEKEVPLVLQGKQHHFFLRFSPVHDRRRRWMGRIAIFQDISQRKQTEEATRKAERLRGILEMAGAICHDLSQPAMASGGYAELIRFGVSENDALHAPLTRLIEQVERLGNINKRLLSITQYKTKTK